MPDWQTVIWSCTVGPALLFAITLVVQWFLAPGLILSDEVAARAKSSADLNEARAKIAALEQAPNPVRSPVEKERLERCRNCLCEFDDYEKNVLRYVVLHHELDERRTHNIGVRHEVVVSALTKARNHDLTRVEVRQGTRFHVINEAMRSSLEALLCG